MFLTLFILIASLAFLIKGSDVVVNRVVSLARIFHISPFVVGLTVVAIGTSIPELVTNIYASFQGVPEIGFGTVIGSNISNFGLIMAIGFFILAAPIIKRNFQNNAVFLLMTSSFFLILSLDGSISLTEGILFLFIFFAYLYFIIKKSSHVLEKEIKEYTEKEIPVSFFSKSFFLTLLHLFFGFGALFIGAKYLISSVVTLSSQMGVSEKILSLTLVAFGTSLPELFVTISSARKGLPDVFFGNLIGSNISNLLLVVGVAALIHPLPVTIFDIFFGLPMMLFITLLALHFFLAKRATTFFTGFLLFLCYGIFLFSLFLFSASV